MGNMGVALQTSGTNGVLGPKDGNYFIIFAQVAKANAVAAINFERGDLRFSEFLEEDCQIFWLTRWLEIRENVGFFM